MTSPSPTQHSDPDPAHRPAKRKGPDISAAQVAGGALAAVSAAVVASFLGVGGTVLGAAVGSIIASVGGALYSHSFTRAGDRLGETKVLTVVTRPRAARELPGPSDVPVIQTADATAEDASADNATAGEAVPGGTSELGETGETGAAGAAGDAEPERSGLFPAPGGRIPRWMSWKAAVLLTVIVFVIALGAIAVVELVLGHPLSGGSGGTTISHLVKPGHSKSKPHTPTPSPSATTPVTTPTTTPTPTPTTSSTSTPSDTSTSPSPTSTVTSTPTGTPTG